MHKATSTVVAIKRVGIDNDLEDIMKEIDFMKGCRSPYIVRYYGSYFKDSELWVCAITNSLLHMPYHYYSVFSIFL